MHGFGHAFFAWWNSFYAIKDQHKEKWLILDVLSVPEKTSLYFTIHLLIKEKCRVCFTGQPQEVLPTGSALWAGSGIQMTEM